MLTHCTHTCDLLLQHLSKRAHCSVRSRNTGHGRNQKEIPVCFHESACFNWEYFRKRVFSSPGKGKWNSYAPRLFEGSSVLQHTRTPQFCISAHQGERFLFEQVPVTAPQGLDSDFSLAQRSLFSNTEAEQLYTKSTMTLDATTKCKC